MIHAVGAHEVEVALRHPRLFAGVAALLGLLAATGAWWKWDEAARTATAPRVATVASLAAARERVEGDWAAVSDARLVPGLVVHRDQGDYHVATDAAGTPILVRLDADEAAAPRIVSPRQTP